MSSTPSKVIADQIRMRRSQLNLNRDELAERCRAIGSPLTGPALTNIETGRPRADGTRRRAVTVDELFALAYALGVHPIDLLIPSEADDDDTYGITPEVTTTAGTARDWVRGHAFLALPKTPADLAEAIRWLPKARADEVLRQWLQPPS